MEASGSFTPRPLYPQGNSPWYPLDRRLGGPQSRFGRSGEEKNSQPPPGIKPWNPDRPARSPVLYRLSYHSTAKYSWTGTLYLHNKRTRRLSVRSYTHKHFYYVSYRISEDTTELLAKITLRVDRAVLTSNWQESDQKIFGSKGDVSS
jgi:hypothetical protein